MKKTLLARWRANFFTGLAVIMPAVISIGALVWIFGTVAKFTDTLLFFLPHDITHRDKGAGTTYWYWSLAAFVLTIVLISAVGLAARNYFGKKMIEWADTGLMRIPLLNKIYGATKQVNDALVTGNKNSFKTVVLIEFPRPGSYSMGFLTSNDAEFRVDPTEKLVCVFVHTTPNPTAGFLLLVPDEKVTRLKMSVADGLKYIISLGAIAPEMHAQTR
ncbi:MAG TPA: DUF502 domain-containing protein [Candidatus Polarisedimenticolia bacterium]|nr:DUF502 domain-containing protein [Candidatus Polarisedimenticolia bacterium]